MNDTTTQYVIPTIVNLTSALLIWLIGKAIAKTIQSKDKVKGVAMSALKTMLPGVFHFAYHAFLLWFFWVQLKPLLMPEGPPSRVEAAQIAFWVWWSLLTLMSMLFEARLYVPRRDGIKEPASR